MMRLLILIDKRYLSVERDSIQRVLSRWRQNLLQNTLGINTELEFGYLDVPQAYEQVHPRYKGIPWKLYEESPWKEKAEDKHATILFHNPDETTEGIANFTYFDRNGTMTWLDDRIKVQIAWSSRWTEDNLYDILVHESIHMMHRILRLQNIPTLDDLDTYQDKSGNDINLARIKPHAAKLSEPLPVHRYKALLSTLVALYQALIAKYIEKRKTLRQLAEAMGYWETNGFNPTTLGMRLNNPTNLRWSKIEDGYYENMNGRYAKFNTLQKGWEAAVLDLSDKRAGRSSWATGETTLEELIKRWSGGENWEPYLQFVTERLGLPKETKLKEFIDA